MDGPPMACRHDVQAPRAPGVIAATTLADKLAAMMALYNADLAPEERDEIFRKLASLEAELDKKGQGFSGQQRTAAVHVERMRLTSVLAFPTTTVFDLEKIDGKVIAIVGPIGSGKSTLVESMLLAMYGRSATRGQLSEISTGEDTLVAVEARTATGEWRITQRLDGPFVRDLRADAAVFKGGAKTPGKPAEFLAWQRRHLPPLALLLATAFCPQEGGGLLTMSPAPAKDLLLGLLGGEVYQRIAAESGKRGRAAKNDALKVRGRIEEAQRVSFTEAAEEQLVRDLAARILDEEALLDGDRRTLATATTTAPTDPGVELATQAGLAREIANAGRRRAEDARRRIAGPQVIEWRAGVRAAADGLPALRAAAAEALAAVQTARRAHDELLGVRHHSKDRRIRALRDGVTALRPRPKGAADIADKAIAEDDAIAAQETAAPAQIKTSEAHLRELQQTAEEADTRVRQAEGYAANLQDVERSEEVENEARVDALSLHDEIREASERAEQLDAAAADARAGYEAVDLVPLEAAVATRTRTLGDLRARHGAATARYEAAGLARNRVVTLGEELGKLEGQQEDWEILERAFGRTGIQALEVEALGPALEAGANGLLARRAGGRWEITIRPTRPDAGGDDIETFEVLVLDTRTGMRKLARRLSPGERLLVGEALTGALLELACKGTPGVMPTIVRDESAVHIDKLDGATWVEMLRDEAELVGASKVLVVTHDPRVMKACHRVVVVKDGAWTEVAA